MASGHVWLVAFPIPMDVVVDGFNLETENLSNLGHLPKPNQPPKARIKTGLQIGSCGMVSAFAPRTNPIHKVFNMCSFWKYFFFERDHHPWV